MDGQPISGKYRMVYVFMMIVEEAQAKGIVKQSPISWDEEFVVDLDEIEIDVTPIKGN